MVMDILAGILNQLFKKNCTGAAIPGADSIALLRETTINR
jgi:hypothetical protein